MSTNKQPSASDQSAPAPPTEKTIYLAMGDVHEAMVATAWAKKTGKRFVSSIPIDRLSPEMVIVPVVRGTDRSPMQYEEWDPIRHQKIRKDRSAADLVGEVMECAPVRVGDFWSGDRNKIQVDDFTEIMGGQLDESGFLDALARSSGVHEVWPRTHHGTANRKVALTWGS